MTTQQLHNYLKANYKEYDSNTSRLVFLYSDFAPAKTSNRYGYDSNINFWKKLLIDTSRAGLLATHGDVLTIETANLEESFAWKSVGSPMGLASVLEEMQQSGDLVPFDHIILSSQEAWPMWILKLLKGPLVWGLQQLSIIGGGTNVRQFIVMPTLQDAATRITKYQSTSTVHGITDNLMTLSDFKDKFTTMAVPGAVLSDTDIMIVIRYLQREKGALAVEERGEEMIIKFRNKSDAMHKRIEVTSVDRGIVSIKETIRSLRRHIEEIEVKIAELTSRAKTTLQKGQRSQSLFALKQRKQLQALLDRRLNSLGTMDEILLKIQDAETDSEIVQAYTVGADTLKSVLASTGITVTTIDDAMDQLRDALSDHHEIEDAIQGATDGIIDHIVGGEDEELEKELEEMVETAKRERDMKERAEARSEDAKREDAKREDAKREDAKREAQRVVLEERELGELNDLLGTLDILPEVPNSRTEGEAETEAETEAEVNARKEREIMLA